MKKLVFTTACALAVIGSAFAQGNVNWGSIPFGNFTAQTNSTTYSPLFGGGSTGSGAIGGTLGSAGAGTGFYVELLYTGSYNGSTAGIAPTTLAGLATWTDSTASGTNNVAAAGRFAAANPSSGFTVSGMNPGTTNYIMVVGWSANLGSTWATALSTLQNASALGALSSQAFLGMSVLGYTTPLSSSTSPGAAVFGSAATTSGLPINSLNTQLFVVPVPEPSTMALAALGGASLLLFRRRK